MRKGLTTWEHFTHSHAVWSLGLFSLFTPASIGPASTHLRLGSGLETCTQDSAPPHRAPGFAEDLPFSCLLLRALRASTGEFLWEDSLGQRGNANPMTFLDNNGNQRIAISATDELIVYGLRD